MKLFLAFIALAALAPRAAAQQPAARPHPADPAAQAQATKYESALSGYRGFREEPLAPWRDVNDEVARAGGHIGIVGGAQGGHVSGDPAVKPAPPQAPAVPAAKTKPEVTSPPAGPGDEHDH